MDSFTRRAHYRIRYPLPERPRLTVMGQTYEVIDCSARGLRYSVAKRDFPPLGSIVEGRLRFRRGTEVHIIGVVIRVQNNEVALHFSNMEISPSILLDEQRYLHAHYPMWS